MIRLSQRVLCLDWDKRYLRLVLARLGRGRPYLLAAHANLIPPEVNPEEPEQMGAFIAQQLRRHQLRARQVLVDVPRDRAVINRLTLPPTPENEVADVVRFQALKELPFPADEAELDFAILSRDEHGRVTEALMAAVLKKTLQRIVATCTAAGLRPVRVGLRPYANLMALKQLAGIEPDRVLFVDVGHSLSEISIYQNSKLAFSRAAAVELAGSHPSGAAISDSRILRASDLDAPADRTERAMGDLLVEITRSLQAYRATDPQLKVETLVIAGGTGLEETLHARAAERLPLDCRLFDVRPRLSVGVDEAAKLRGFSAALGLCWGLNKAGVLELDFLNPKRPVPRGAVRLRRARIMGLAAATIGVCLFTWWFLTWQGNVRTLKYRQTQIAALQAQVKELVKIRQAVDVVREWETSAVWPEELLQISLSAVEPGKKMLVQQVRLDQRTAKIELKQVQADHHDVPMQFVKNLNDVQRDGRAAYVAEQKTWTEQQHSSRKYSGAVDVVVLLRDLYKHVSEAGLRDKQRKQELRGL